MNTTTNQQGYAPQGGAPPQQRGPAQQQPARQQPAESKNAPVHELRIGRIKGTIWLNETQNGARYNTTFARLYRVEDQWRETGSFGRDDLPLLAKVADQCHSWIFANVSNQNGNAEQAPF